MRTWYAIVDEDELYNSYDEAYNVLEYLYEGGSSDYYDELCEEMIYEIDGYEELLDFFDNDLEVAALYTPANDLGILEEVSKRRGGGKILKH